MRPETGPMKFDNDWRGLFIRGDTAFAFAMQLRRAIEACPDPIARGVLNGLASLLESTNEHTVTDAYVQRMKPFENCVVQ